MRTDRKRKSNLMKTCLMHLAFSDPDSCTWPARY